MLGILVCIGAIEMADFQKKENPFTKVLASLKTYRKQLENLQKEMESKFSGKEDVGLINTVKEFIENTLHFEALAHRIDSMTQYGELVTFNDKINTEKKRNQEAAVLEESRKIAEQLQKTYEEFKKRKEAEEIEKEMRFLIARLAVINQRLNEIQQEQYEIVARMITNLDEFMEMSLRDIPGTSHLIDHDNEENNIIRISRRDLQERILQNSKGERRDNFDRTPARIIAESAYEIFTERLAELDKEIELGTAPEAKAHVMNVLEIKYEQAIRADINYVENAAQFNASMNERAELIKEGLEVKGRIDSLQQMVSALQKVPPAMEAVQQVVGKEIDRRQANVQEVAAVSPVEQPVGNKESVAPAPTHQADKIPEKKETTHSNKSDEQVKKQNPEKPEAHAATNKETTKKRVRKNLSELNESADFKQPEPSSSPRPH